MESHAMFMDWRTQRGKDVNFPKLIYRFNTFPIIIQVRFLTYRQAYSKMYMEMQRK